MVSTFASVSSAQIAAARVSPSQPIFFQLYKDKDDRVSEKLVHEIEQLGFNAIFLTVDAPLNGNRERDLRAPFELEAQERAIEEAENPTGGSEMPRKPEEVEEISDDELVLIGTSGGLRRSSDWDMSWEKVRGFFNSQDEEANDVYKTIPWLRETTKLPIVLKGIPRIGLVTHWH